MKWIVDEDGWIGLSFWGVVTFTKYKYGTIIRWFHKFPEAVKFHGSLREFYNE